jgi:hypothetical protein
MTKTGRPGFGPRHEIKFTQPLPDERPEHVIKRAALVRENQQLRAENKALRSTITTAARTLVPYAANQGRRDGER